MSILIGTSVGHFYTFRGAAMLITVLVVASCAGRGSGPGPLTAETPLHLEGHLDSATIEGSDVPEDIPEVVEWRFD